jgi:hypothetical protein
MIKKNYQYCTIKSVFLILSMKEKKKWIVYLFIKSKDPTYLNAVTYLFLNFFMHFLLVFL